jgi:hypothetical protein
MTPLREWLRPPRTLLLILFLLTLGTGLGLHPESVSIDMETETAKIEGLNVSSCTAPSARRTVPK